MINLEKEPDYLYSLHYNDLYDRDKIYLDKDSINSTYIIPNYEELIKTRFVTDKYNNKSRNIIKKNARYTSLLPRVKLFDKIIMLIFGPKFEMITQKNENNDNQYIGFQSFEFTGPNNCDYVLDIDNPPHNRILKANKIKLDYLITNYHLLTINKIRKMINEMIEPIFCINEEEKDEEKNKKMFEKKKELYSAKAGEILKQIKILVKEPKFKYISEKKYIELNKYIEEFNRKFKNSKNRNIQVQNEKEEGQYKNEESKEDDDKMVEQKKEISNSEYIKEIEGLKNKEEDFLQFHQPLEIEEFYHDENKLRKLLNNEEKLSKIYDEYNEVLRSIKSLSSNKNALICCPNCKDDICEIKKGSPKMTERKNIGEHVLEWSWITISTSIKENKDRIQKEQIEEFKESLKNNNIKYDDLLCCSSGESIIGYIYKGIRYISCFSKLCVRYPDLNIDDMKAEDYKNDFKDIHEKVKKILEEKETDKFKKNICCKLCDFKVEKNLFYLIN